MAKKIITVVGGGGKTTFLNLLAQLLVKKQEKVLLTTTTHMMKPSFLSEAHCLEEENMQKLSSLYEKTSLAALGIPCCIIDGQTKWKSPSLSFLKNITQLSCPDFILCEGDGSRGLPIKLPRKGEPVLFPETDTVFALIGLSCYKKPLDEIFFRRELLPDTFPDFHDTIVTADLLFRMSDPGVFLPKNAGISDFHIIFNQADVLSESNLSEILDLCDKIRDNGISCHVVSLKNQYLLQ